MQTHLITDFFAPILGVNNFFTVYKFNITRAKGIEFYFYCLLQLSVKQITGIEKLGLTATEIMCKNNLYSVIYIRHFNDLKSDADRI
jgi:hypothetical protein